MSAYDSPRETAEAAALGAVLITERALEVLTDERVRPEHFRRASYSALYAAMLNQRDLGQGIDALTLKARFDTPQSPVTLAEIDMLAGAVPNLGNVREYCRIIREGAWFDQARRTLYEAGDAIERHDREAAAAAFASITSSDDTTEHADNAGEFMDWYDSDRQTWPLPFDQLNEAVGGGLVPGEVTVIGAWSGFGKSFLVAQILRRAVKAGATVKEYANEMHGPKRTVRTLTSMTGIPAWMIEKKKLSPQQLKVVLQALKGLPYETVATAGWRVEQYCASLRRHKPDVAAIDTVTNLPYSRVDEWDRACVMLADAAAQTGTHLILVCQLNLERDKGKRPPPVGRDLRNTGAWYQRARVVMFVHRDQESTESGDGERIWRSTSDGHIRVDKTTHGDGDPVKGFLPVTFNPKWLRFDELDAYRRPLEAAA